MAKEKPTYQELEQQIAELKLQNEILQLAKKSEINEDRLNAILALKQSEVMFRTTLYCIGDGVITTDASGFVKQLNAVAEQLTGWKEQEAKGMPVTKVFPIINEDTRCEVESPVDLVLREGQIVGLANHTLLIAKDGTQIPIADSGAPIKNENGEIVGTVLVFRDQTKERHSQRLVEEALSRLKRAEIASKSGIWELHLDTNKVITSEGAQMVYGLKGDLLDYEYIKSIPLPEYRPLLDTARKNLIEENIPYDLEFKIMLPDTGEIKDIHSLCSYDKERRILFGTVRDITRQKKALEALEESEKKLNLFFSQSLDGFFFMMLDEPVEWNDSIDKDQTLEYVFSHQRMTKVNDAMLEQYKASRDQFLNLTPADLYAHDIDYGKRVWREFFDTGKLHIETEERQLDGSTLFIEGDYICLHDSKGRITGHFGIQRDITQRKQIELALRKSEELMKVFFDANLDMMFVKDDQRRYLLANKAMADFFGKKKRDLIGKTDESLAENSRIYPCMSSDLKTLDAVKMFAFEEQLGDKLVETTKFPLNLNGQKGIGGIIRDISERKKSEKLIRTFGEAIEQSPVAITITNADGIIEFVNKEYVALTQYTLEDLKGKKPRIFNPGHLSSAHYETMWKTLCYGQIWKGEYINRRKDHTEFQVEVIISAIQHADGSISNFVIVMDDVTEKKRMINELIIAKDRAEESERLKSAFLANMSHEIRTPMNGILGFAELLKEPDLTGEEQQQYIAIIEESGARMLNIINDIISISKIESGLMKVNIQPSNINDQIEFIYTFFKPEVERKGMTLSCTYTLPSEKSILLTDKEKVYAILINLVKNAIKYSEKGSIDFGYTKKGDFLEFYVKDTGMGIPKERQEAIFERFIQADITDQSALQGAGLGLSIAKAYIEMLGGDLWVESEVGKGSTFYFTLPYPTEK